MKSTAFDTDLNHSSTNHLPYCDVMYGTFPKDISIPACALSAQPTPASSATINATGRIVKLALIPHRRCINRRFFSLSNVAPNNHIIPKRSGSRTTALATAAYGVESSVLRLILSSISSSSSALTCCAILPLDLLRILSKNSTASITSIRSALLRLVSRFNTAMLACPRALPRIATGRPAGSNDKCSSGSSTVGFKSSGSSSERSSPGLLARCTSSRNGNQSAFPPVANFLLLGHSSSSPLSRLQNVHDGKRFSQS